MTTAISWAGDVKIGEVVRDPRQPRQYFDEKALEQLAESIRAQGVIEPLIVRPIEPLEPGSTVGKYVLVAGERRLRAAKRAGLETVPVVVRKYEAQQARVAQLGENMDREALRPLEIAESYHRWLQPTGNAITTVSNGKLRQKADYKRNQAELAKALGKTEAHVSQLLALRELPAPARALLDAGTLSLAHARPLLPLIEYPPALKRIVALIEERVRWGYVFTSREIAERAGRELTRVKAAAARRAARAKGKGKRKAAAPVDSWRVEQERRRAEQERDAARRKAGLRVMAPKFEKAFAGDRVHQLVAKIPRIVLRAIAAGLRLPSWGDEREIVETLNVGTKPARRVAAWLFLRRRMTVLNRQVTSAGAAAVKTAATPARKGGRK